MMNIFTEQYQELFMDITSAIENHNKLDPVGVLLVLKNHIHWVEVQVKYNAVNTLLEINNETKAD